MKIIKIILAVVIFSNFSCNNNPEKSKVDSVQNDNKSEFDAVAATDIIEKRSKEFEEALIAGDSIAVGDIYTIDTKIIPYLNGRKEIVGAARSMIRDSTSLRLTIKNLWGDDNIIIEDAYVEFYKINGEVTGKGNVLLVWKNDGGEWRIFRDVYKPDEE